MNLYAQNSALKNMLAEKDYGKLHKKGDSFALSDNILISYSPISKKSFNGYRIKLEARDEVDTEEFNDLISMARDYDFKFKNIKVLLSQKDAQIPCDISDFIENTKNPSTGKRAYFIKHISTKKDFADNQRKKSLKISAHAPLEYEKSSGLIELIKKYIKK